MPTLGPVKKDYTPASSLMAALLESDVFHPSLRRSVSKNWGSQRHSSTRFWRKKSWSPARSVVANSPIASVYLSGWLNPVFWPFGPVT